MERGTRDWAGRHAEQRQPNRTEEAKQDRGSQTGRRKPNRTNGGEGGAHGVGRGWDAENVRK